MTVQREEPKRTEAGTSPESGAGHGHTVAERGLRCSLLGKTLKIPTSDLNFAHSLDLGHRLSSDHLSHP